MMRLLRGAYVIGRRDFAATVLSKAFIFFLLGPIFPLLLGGVFGGIGARVASQTEQPVVAIVSSADAVRTRALMAAATSGGPPASRLRHRQANRSRSARGTLRI